MKVNASRKASLFLRLISKWKYTDKSIVQPVNGFITPAIISLAECDECSDTHDNNTNNNERTHTQSH